MGEGVDRERFPIAWSVCPTGISSQNIVNAATENAIRCSLIHPFSRHNLAGFFGRR